VLVLGVGAMLVLIGGAGLVVSGVRRRKILKVLLVLPVLLAFSAADPSTAAGRLIYHHDGRYALIRIFDGVMPDGRPVRSLRIDDSSSAARYLDGNDLVYGYTRFADLLPVWRPDARKALVIGGGAYSVPEALVKQLPRASVDVAEIEPDLYSLSKQYFGVQDNPRLVNHVEDGRHFLHGKTGQYDLIFGDAYYSVSSIPQHLATREFFELAKSSLTDNGIYMMNVIGRLGAQQPSFTLSEIKTFRTVFPNGQVVAVNDPKSPEVQNLMFIGGKGVMPDLSSVASQTVDLGRYDLAPHRVFTDDFSPIDYYIATTVDFHS
jgi:hypothetical protein